MISIGSYLLLFISLAGMTLSNDYRFSKKDIAMFLRYIFRLHVGVRYKHDAPTFHRTDDMDELASKIMDDMYSYNGVIESNDSYGIYHNSMPYDENTKLDGDEAKKFFSTWYEQGNFYDYNHEPIDYSAVGAFTQILWMGTSVIGLAFSYEPDKYVVLAVYDPPGNVVGKYTKNVQRPLSSRRAWDPANITLLYQTETEKLIENILILHNNVRLRHGAGSLIHDIDLDSIAYSMLKNEQTTHPRYGVNSYEIEIDENTKLGYGAVAVELFSKWYVEEQQHHSYHKEPFFNNADSFTQILWNNTQKIGVSYIKKSNGRYKFIVLYDPPGNIPGEYANNVFMPQTLEEEGSSEDN